MFFYLLLTSVFLTLAVRGYKWPNYPIDEVEHLLVDTDGFNDGGFRKAITPCTNYISGSQLLGRETAAQWIRVSFHDFVTANVTAGTGGIDASIGFETLREENSGSAMNDSLAFFAPFVNAHRSMADMIALSVVMSVGGCSNPPIHVPLRVGRIDAKEGGPFGVPEPETGIEETLAEFSNAGFNQSDAIALTACGHTMGSVHHGGFPQVVNASAVTPNNTGGGIHFDATPDVFDIDVVDEYLSWTGQQGGPLVTTPNETVRSDLRLYTSDNNSTMRILSESSAFFTYKCISLLARMIDTVPSAVSLSEPIIPPAGKPVNVSLTLDSNGELRFSGYIRLLATQFTSNSSVTLSWSSRNGTQSPKFKTAITIAGFGNGIFGATFYYFFNTSIEAASGISAFFVTVVEGNSTITFKNGGTGFPIQDIAFYLPDQSTISNEGEVTTVAAVLTSANITDLSVVFSIPSPQQGTLSPQILQSTVNLSPTSESGLYTLYSASASLSLTNIDQTALDLVAQVKDGKVIKDQFRKLSGF